MNNNRKKIGILTFHRANNLGAVLQASALQKYIKDNYGYVKIIDYYPNNAIPNKESFIKKILRNVKRTLTYRKVKINTMREQKFFDYRKKYMDISSEKYYGDKSIINNPPKYDVFISGSDQILNTTLTGNSEAYYLKFVKNSKKISYASSFGREHITEYENNLITTELITFDNISVRENSGKQIIQEIANIDATLVVDPVFLLDECEWETRANDNLNIPDNYIFVYSMENSEIIEQIVELVRKEYNLPIIFVRGGGKKYRIKGIEDKICGPEDFLGYIKNAKVIITNSFHGTAFSLIFKRDFLCIAHSSRNTRLENLMRMVDMQDYIIDHSVSKNEVKKYLVHGEKCKEKLKSYIEDSKKFLEISIKE